jgi:hypothetical protein
MNECVLENNQKWRELKVVGAKTSGNLGGIEDWREPRLARTKTGENQDWREPRLARTKTGENQDRQDSNSSELEWREPWRDRRQPSTRAGGNENLARTTIGGNLGGIEGRRERNSGGHRNWRVPNSSEPRMAILERWREPKLAGTTGSGKEDRVLSSRWRMILDHDSNY